MMVRTISPVMQTGAVPVAVQPKRALPATPVKVPLPATNLEFGRHPGRYTWNNTLAPLVMMGLALLMLRSCARNDRTGFEYPPPKSGMGPGIEGPPPLGIEHPVPKGTKTLIPPDQDNRNVFP